MSESRNALMECAHAVDLPIGVIAEAFVGSGYFDTQKLSQAAVKIMAGQELGIGPFAAMRGISIINGRPSLGADILAAKLREHPRYDYVVNELTAERCTVTIREKQTDGNWRDCPPYTFTMADAEKAGLTKNRGSQQSLYHLYPARMLFTVAIAHAQRIFAPDALAFTGYTEGEQPAFDSPSPMAEGRHRPEPAAILETGKHRGARPEATAAPTDFEEVRKPKTSPSEAIRNMGGAIKTAIENADTLRKATEEVAEPAKAAEAELPATLSEFLDRRRIRSEFLESLVTDENRDEIESWADYPGGVEAQAALIQHCEEKLDGGWPWGTQSDSKPEPTPEPKKPVGPVDRAAEKPEPKPLPFDFGDGEFAD